MRPKIKKVTKLLPQFSLPRLPSIKNIDLNQMVTIFIKDDSPLKSFLYEVNKPSIELFGGVNMLKFVSKEEKEGYFPHYIPLCKEKGVAVKNIVEYVKMLEPIYNTIKAKVLKVQNYIEEFNNILSILEVKEDTTQVNQANKLSSNIVTDIDEITQLISIFDDFLRNDYDLIEAFKAVNQYGIESADHDQSKLNQFIEKFNNFFQEKW